MKEPKDDRISPPERTRQTKAPSMRAHSLTPEQSHNRRKRKCAKPETLKPDLRQCLAVSNTFLCLRSWSRRRRKHSRTEQPGAGSSRRWAYSCHDSSSFRDKVVVVSYNILGVENASKHPDLYYKVSQKFMEWNKQKALMCEEINQYNEVDRFGDLDHLFHKDGFKGVYKMNQSQSELDEHPQKMLQCTQSRSFVIRNIHALFNPNHGYINVGQVRLLLEKASKLSQEWGCIPVLLCGDLNGIPQSPMYQFLASSKLDIQLHDRRNISGQVEFQSKCRGLRDQNEKARSLWASTPMSLGHRWSEEELKLATGSGGVTHLRHHLKLCSAYLGVPVS